MRSSFIPQFKGSLYRKAGYSETGLSYFDKSVTVRFSYVRFREQLEQTSIRTDKSGSKNRAREVYADLRIMTYPSTKPAFEDEFELDDGTRYKVVSVIPRYEMSNILNHYQVDLKKAVSGENC